MILVGLLGGYLTLLLGGLGVALLVTRGEPRLNIIEYCCLAWLFGTGVVSLLLWICGTFIPGIALQAIVAIACVFLGFVGWRVKQRAAAQFILPIPRGFVEWLLASCVVAEIATLLFASCKHSLGWDGLLNWEIKARYAFMNDGVIPASYYSDSGRAFSHPEYPLGIPFTELWLYLWMGQANQFWVKTIFPLFYAAGSLLLALLGSRISGQRWSGLLVAALVPFIPYFVTGPGGVFVAYADIPLNVFYLAALGYLIYSLDHNGTSMSMYAGCSTLLPWIKREGLILWLVLALLGLVVSLRGKKLQPFLLSLLPGLFVTVSWQIYLAVRHAVPSSDFSGLTVRTLHENMDRIVPICRALVREMADLSHWSIFWLLAGFGLFYLLVRVRNMRSYLLTSAILMPIILYCITYLFSEWPSYTAHITSSLPRLLLHIVSAAWLAVALVLPFSLKVKRKHVTSFSLNN